MASGIAGGIITGFVFFLLLNWTLSLKGFEPIFRDKSSKDYGVNDL